MRYYAQLTSSLIAVLATNRFLNYVHYDTYTITTTTITGLFLTSSMGVGCNCNVPVSHEHGGQCDATFGRCAGSVQLSLLVGG